MLRSAPERAPAEEVRSAESDVAAHNAGFRKELGLFYLPSVPVVIYLHAQAGAAVVAAPRRRLDFSHDAAALRHALSLSDQRGEKQFLLHAQIAAVIVAANIVGAGIVVAARAKRERAR